MRITQEADYALRIVSFLAASDTICGAGETAARTGVPARFAHKILRKLMQGGIIKSYTGAKGGYCLLCEPSKLSMLDVIEQIDGPLEISKCMDDAYVCSKNGTCKQQCMYHQIFRHLSSDVAGKLGKITIEMISYPGTEINDIQGMLK